MGGGQIQGLLEFGNGLTHFSLAGQRDAQIIVRGALSGLSCSARLKC